MDMDTVILLRFLERILAVAIGGLAIYLGYRLFSLVPESKDSEGRVVLSKDVSIVLSRVGPGVFFALFGAVAVGLSLQEKIELTTGPNPEQETAIMSVRFSGAGAPGADAEDVRTDARRLLRRDIAVLNTLPQQLDPDLPAHGRADIDRALARIKLALMKPVWPEAEGWGTPDDFERWQKEGEPGDPPEEIAEAVKYFNYPSSENSP